MYLSFIHPEYFLLLLLLPLLVFAHRLFYRFTKKQAIIFSNFETLKRVRKDTKMRSHLFAFIGRILVFALLIAALVQPTLHYEGERQPSDYVLAIDTSASMTATDIAPNRFEAAKTLASGFVDSVDAQAAIGVVGFSGYPLVAEKLSNDTAQIKSAIDTLRIPETSGTDIAGAIVTSTNVLAVTDRGKSIILVTDGVSTAGQSQSDSIASAISYARDYDVTIHAIAIGSEAAAPLGYLPTLYNVSAQYSEIDLVRITNQTNGQLYRAEDLAEFEDAFAQLQEAPESVTVSYSLTQILLLLGLLLLFIEWAFINSRLRIIP